MRGLLAVIAGAIAAASLAVGVYLMLPSSPAGGDPTSGSGPSPATSSLTMTRTSLTGSSCGTTYGGAAISFTL